MEDTRIKKYREAAHSMNKGLFRVEISVDGTDEDDVDLLGKEIKALGSNLEKKFEEIKLLSDVTKKINAGLLLDDVLDYIFQSFRPTIPYDRIGFSLLEENGKVVRARWARSDAPKICIQKGYAAQMEGSSLEEIITTGKPRIINDLEEHLRRHPKSDSTRRVVEEGMRSSLTCPLVALAKPVGFMFFSSMQKNTYGNLHVEFFQQIAGELSLIVEKSKLYQQILEEQKKSDRLLLNILPQAIADRLKEKEEIIADSFSEVSVLFSDLVGFTKFSSQMPPRDLVTLLNNIFSEFDRLSEKYRVEKIKTIGDAYMAAAGLSDPCGNHAQDVAEMALDMIEVIQKYSSPDGSPLNIRIGLHSGPVVAGVIGKKKFIYDLWGDTVNTASRMESHGLPGRIHISADTRRLLSENYETEERGVISVKGKGEMSTYFLNGRKNKTGGGAIESVGQS